jgi:hypothetical protein
MVRVLKTLRWIRRTLLMGLLVVALSALGFVLGCDDKDDPAPVYGPPPDTWTGDDTAGLDTPGPLPDALMDTPRVYYGPMPVDVVEDSLPDIDPTDQPRTYYGPMPTDIVEEDIPAAVDTVHDSATKPDCEPMAYYGPPPCDSDEECANAYGEGWYCDKENTFSDGCGGQSTWPVCKEK